MGKSYEEVDCCALIKRAQRACEIDGIFKWVCGEWNQGYQYALSLELVALHSNDGGAEHGTHSQLKWEFDLTDTRAGLLRKEEQASLRLFEGKSEEECASISASDSYGEACVDLENV